MRRFVFWVGVFATVWVMAAVAAAQAKPTLEQLDRVMKKDGPAQQGLVKAIVAGNQATAKQNSYDKGETAGTFCHSAIRSIIFQSPGERRRNTRARPD